MSLELGECCNKFQSSHQPRVLLCWDLSECDCLVLKDCKMFHLVSEISINDVVLKFRPLKYNEDLTAFYP